MPGTVLSALGSPSHSMLTTALNPWVLFRVRFTDDDAKAQTAMISKIPSPWDTPFVHIFVPFANHMLGLDSFPPPS